jgi:FMN-dependent NADH-azoreductase
MGKLLYIQASPRGEQSKSITAADAFVTEYLKTHPDDQIETVNVFNPAIPEFDAPAVQAKYKIMQGQEHSAEDSKAWKDVEKLIEQFKSADKYVLALPMWNFSIPYRLKLYIDILVQPGYTFTYSEDTGYQGLVIGKPILAVYARGGEYPEGSEAEAFDLQKKYIELIFGFMGFENIRSVVIEPTLQGGPEVAEARLREAVEKAKELAAVF